MKIVRMYWCKKSKDWYWINWCCQEWFHVLIWLSDIKWKYLRRCDISLPNLHSLTKQEFNASNQPTNIYTLLLFSFLVTFRSSSYIMLFFSFSFLAYEISQPNQFPHQILLFSKYLKTFNKRIFYTPFFRVKKHR